MHDAVRILFTVTVCDAEAEFESVVQRRETPQEIEEKGSMRYSMDYTFTKQVLSGRTANGTGIYSTETARGTFSAPTKPLFLVRNG